MNISNSRNSIADYYNPNLTVRAKNSNPHQANISPENKSQNGKIDKGAENAGEDRDAAKGPLTELSDEEERQVDQLKKRDAEVKAHERAHIAAGGSYVSGGASYEYERGPDNQNYAVGGEVSIDVSAENTPEATIRKMQIVKRAALAPKDPSGQDRSVAAQATQTEARARMELQKERSEKTGKEDKQISGSQPGQQALAAYRQTELTTSPRQNSNLSRFNVSA
ncbi:MAG: catalase [Deltaproteobacteria bacterium]|nr:catalase [Candidatus Tharpella sp.]